MLQFIRKSKQKVQSRSFRSNLDFRVYTFPYDTPQGIYQPIGTTPGEIEIPVGYSIIVSPIGLSPDLLSSYANDISSQKIEAVYLSEVLDCNLLEAFCKSNEHIRHIVLESCGFNLTPIETLAGLEVLEIHNNVQVSSLACIEKLPFLKGLFITSSNNVFSSYIPTSESLEQLLLFNIARLVRLEEIIERLEDKFPNLRKFHLNKCGCSDLQGEIEISHLYKLKHLQEFQAAGTRVVGSSGAFYAYCQERHKILGYIDTIEEPCLEAKFHWEFTHNIDLEKLHEKAPGIKSLELNGCRDVNDLNILSGFTMLESLALINCWHIHSLEPLNTLGKLRILSVNKCRKIADYRCLTKCSTLEKLEIFQGDDSIIPTEVYREQLADLCLALPRCSWKYDVPDHEITLLIEEVPQFIKAVKEELQCSTDCPCQIRGCEYA